MVAPRKLPDQATLRRLRVDGLRLQDIADRYGVTESAVWKAMDRAGFTEVQPTYRDVLPWQIAAEHKTTAVMDRFRSIAKQRAGRKLTDREETLLRDWLHGLAENDVVVAYHPEAPANAASSKGGFYYVPRQDTDQWIIREPEPRAESEPESQSGS